MNPHTVALTLQRNLELVVGIVAVALVVATIAIFILRKRPRKLNAVTNRQRWLELQKMCASKTTWPDAILQADEMLDETLKRLKYKGKTMGERLVSAQRDLSSNETVWFGHKLRNKIVHEEYKLTRKNEVKEALLGYWQALKDLGALKK